MPVAAPAPDAPPRNQAGGGRLLRWVGPIAALAVAGYGVALALMAGAGAGATAAFCAYWLLAVLVPGTLVHKGLRGTQGTWAADLTYGAVTGLALELFAWAAFTLAHAQHLLIAWPAVSLLVLAFPSARRRLRQRPESVAHPGWAIATAAAIAIGFQGLYRTYLTAYDLLPFRRSYYVDLPWHMSLIAEAQRAFPLLTPQLADAGPIKYSWFVHAHLAAASLVSGVDYTVIFLRLWPLPIIALAVLAPAVVTRQLTKSAGAGALAAWLTLTAASFPWWSAYTGADDIFRPVSPTQLYSLPISTLLLGVLVPLVRSGRAAGAGTAVVAGLLAVLTMGSKSSIMLMIACGVGAAWLACLALRRNRAVTFGLTASAGVLTLGALALVSGGNYGTRLQPFASLTLLPAYRVLVGPNDFLAPLPPGFRERGGLVLLGVLLVAVLVRFARQLSFLLPFFDGRLRRDPAAWLFAGAVFAAWPPFFLMGHRGHSEYYFQYGAVPFAAVLLAWWASGVVGDDRGARRVALGVGAGVALASLAVATVLRWRVGPSGGAAWWAAGRDFALQVGVGAVVLGVVSLIAWVLARRGRAALAGVPVALLLAPSFGGVASTVTVEPRPVAGATLPTNLPEGEAALWLRENTASDTLVATNAPCLNSAPSLECFARRWWISGLAGRRVLLEGWGYTSAFDGTRFTDPALYDFNSSLFADPTPQNLGEAYGRGVRWLVAERLPGLTVSPRLDTLADKRYDNGTVAIYELRRP